MNSFFLDRLPVGSLPAVWWLASRLSRGGEAAEIEKLSNHDWRNLSAKFPALGPWSWRRIPRARRRLWFLSERSLATSRHGPRWDGGRPDAAPAVYLTSHLGDLRALRYAFRIEGIAAASVISPETFGRTGSARPDSRCDRRCAHDFPHLISSANAHRLRKALERGSIIITIDGPMFEFVETPFLGGVLRLDPRPLRLARLAGVPARAAFLTAPRGRLTVTLGRTINPAEDPAAAIAEVGLLLNQVASRSPLDFDAWSHSRLSPAAAPAGAQALT